MARLLAYLIDIIVLYFVLRNLFGVLLRLVGQRNVRNSKSAQDRAKRMVQGEMARDPVCGMFVATELSHRLTLRGCTLHFCSRECLEQYQKTHA